MVKRRLLRGATISLLVIISVAATTAGGFAVSVGQPARLAVDSIGEELARSLGSGEVERPPGAKAVSDSAAASELVGEAGVAPLLSPGSARSDADVNEAQPEAIAAADSAPSEVSDPDTEPTSELVEVPTQERNVAQTADSSVSPPTTAAVVSEPVEARPSQPAQEDQEDSAPTTRRPSTTTTVVERSVPDDAVEPDEAVEPVARVSTSGTVTGAGFANTPVAQALKSSQPGTVFEFAAGRHDALLIEQVRDITITAADPNEPPLFTSDNYARAAGIDISSSSGIEISNVVIQRSLWGIRVQDSTAVTINGVNVSDVGQEGIRIAERSSNVVIRDSRISNTGNRPGSDSSGRSYSHFGEGIYVGTGRGDSDTVSNVRIIGNHISATTAEAIDIKVPVRDVEIRRNTISDVRTAASGAIVVHAEDDFSAVDANIEIKDNRISNISTTSSHRDGVAIVLGSSAEVSGNSISGTQHYGIRVEDSGPQGANITVDIRDNDFASIGLDPVWQASDKATVTLSGNSGV